MRSVRGVFVLTAFMSLLLACADPRRRPQEPVLEEPTVPEDTLDSSPEPTPEAEAPPERPGQEAPEPPPPSPAPMAQECLLESSTLPSGDVFERKFFNARGLLVRRSHLPRQEETLYGYDEQDREIHRQESAPHASRVSASTYASDGRPLLYRSATTDSQGRSETVHSFQYDGLGRLDFILKTLNGALESTESTHYDAMGHKVLVEDSHTQGWSLARTAYAYHPNGISMRSEFKGPRNEYLEERFDSEGRLLSWRSSSTSAVYERDAQGRVVRLFSEYWHPRGGGSITRTIESSYDAQGRVLVEDEEKHMSAGGPHGRTRFKRVFSYGDAQALVRIDQYQEGAWDGSRELTHDARGRLVRDVRTGALSPDGVLITDYLWRSCSEN